MKSKKANRLRRAQKTRNQIRIQGRHRLCVKRTPNHIYAQVITPDGSKTIASASTVEPEVRKQIAYGGNAEAARVVGALIAKKAIEAKVEHLAFDRSGHRYHGRIKALADAARENGLRI